tara:strand:- start:776 stop:1069 length:294 start_codon:yes stop_codon:yes gene_type:complete
VEHVWFEISPDTSYTSYASSYDTMVFRNGKVTSKIFFFKEVPFAFPADSRITIGSQTYDYYFEDNNQKLHIQKFVPKNLWLQPPGSEKVSLVLTKIN